MQKCKSNFFFLKRQVKSERANGMRRTRLVLEERERGEDIEKEREKEIDR